jgi:hypothetical protein
MTFTDWVFEKSSSDIVTSTEIFSPIDPTGSLKVEHLSGSNLFMNTYNDTYVRGIVKGRIRSLIEPVTLTGSGRYMIGFTFMQSQDDLTGSTSVGTGDAYGAFYTAEANGTDTRFTIRKYIGGLSSYPGGTSLYLSSSFGLVGSGMITAMEVEWDATSGTQVDITLRAIVNDTDFNNMVVLTAITDNTSPFVTTLSEGLASVGDISSIVTWRVDNTTIFSVL